MGERSITSSRYNIGLVSIFTTFSSFHNGRSRNSTHFEKRGGDIEIFFLPDVERVFCVHYH